VGKKEEIMPNTLEKKGKKNTKLGTIKLRKDRDNRGQNTCKNMNNFSIGKIINRG